MRTIFLIAGRNFENAQKKPFAMRNAVLPNRAKLVYAKRSVSHVAKQAPY